MKQVEDLTLIKVLGKGAYGEVYLSKKANSNKLFATKRIDKFRADNQLKKYFQYEINIMKGLNHENIIKLEDIKMTANNYYVVLEYLNGGDLKSCLHLYMQRYNTPFPEVIVQHLMKQIVRAVAYFHEFNVIHRDLKLDNIMVNFDSEKDKQDLNMMRAKIKIIDFGCSIVIPSQGGFCFTAAGTPGYMAPFLLEEYYRNAKREGLVGYGKEVDIWSLGCLCYELLMGKVPFNSKEIPNLINQMNEGTYTLPPNSSAEIRDFLSKMLKHDGKARATARELFFHPFLTNDVRNFGKINIAQQINNNQNGGGILERIEMEKQRRAALNYKGQKSAPIQYTPYNQNQINLNFPPQPQPPNPHAMFQYPGNVPNYQVPGYNNNNMFQYYQ
jgi:serine/threonine protein kinase